jgi:hypothetical protein
MCECALPVLGTSREIDNCGLALEEREREGRKTKQNKQNNSDEEKHRAVHVGVILVAISSSSSPYQQARGTLLDRNY